MDLGRCAGAVRSWWFKEEAPAAPGQEEVDLINKFARFHTVNKETLRPFISLCPRIEYLTNPVNMRWIGTASPVGDRVIASWSGNADHWNPAHQDVKGFRSIVQPACSMARIPLIFAEYTMNRIAPCDMPDFYRSASIVLCASLYEGASNSVMEAMAAGLAVVATNVGNHREMQESQLRHLGDTGIIIIEDRSKEAFADVLCSLKHKRIAEMGAINRHEIAERWSWDSWKDRYAVFLHKALEWIA